MAEVSSKTDAALPRERKPRGPLRMRRRRCLLSAELRTTAESLMKQLEGQAPPRQTQKRKSRGGGTCLGHV